MSRFILSRFVQAVICLIFVSVVVFFLARMSGSPLDVYMSDYSTPEDRQAMAVSMGLDKPIPVQYLIFVRNAVQGDFGRSTRGNRPALAMVLERFPATFQLGGVAIGLSILLALPVGVLSATRRGTSIDTAARMFAVGGQATPIFWFGLVLMLVFAVWLGVLPSGGSSGPKSLILPAVAMGWYNVAGIMRITRSSMLDVLDTEYIKLLRAKGLPEWQVIWKHALKNAAIPILTFSVILFVMMLAGAVITETVFSWPGVGRLVIQSVNYRDYPVVQTVVILLSTMYILANLAVDILYAYLNPKIRYQR